MDQTDRHCTHDYKHRRGFLEHDHPNAHKKISYKGPNDHELLLSCDVIDVGFFGEPQGLRPWEELTDLSVDQRVENGAWVYVLNQEFDLLLDEYEEEPIPAAIAEAVAARIDDLAGSPRFPEELRLDLNQLARFIRDGGRQGLDTCVVL